MARSLRGLLSSPSVPTSHRLGVADVIEITIMRVNVAPKGE